MGAEANIKSAASSTGWSDAVDDVVSGDVTACLACATPAGGCVVTPVATVGLHDRERPACFSINNAILNQIRILEPDIVVLSAQWDNVGVDHRRVLDSDELVHTIKLVKAAGVKRVVVIGSAPFWTSALPGLLVDEIEHNPRNPVPHRLTRGLLAPHDDTLLKETAERAGAVYLPVFESLCDRSSCIATTGPTWSDVVAYDNAHFTEHGSVLVAHRIWANIAPFQSPAYPIEN